MSDLGNGGRPNGMKLGKVINLDELLQKYSLVDFVSGCLQFSMGGGSYLGAQNHPKTTCLRVNFQVTFK